MVSFNGNTQLPTKCAPWASVEAQRRDHGFASPRSTGVTPSGAPRRRAVRFSRPNLTFSSLWIPSQGPRDIICLLPLLCQAALSSFQINKQIKGSYFYYTMYCPTRYYYPAHYERLKKIFKRLSEAFLMPFLQISFVWWFKKVVVIVLAIHFFSFTEHNKHVSLPNIHHDHSMTVELFFQRCLFNYFTVPLSLDF